MTATERSNLIDSTVSAYKDTVYDREVDHWTSTGFGIPAAVIRSDARMRSDEDALGLRRWLEQQSDHDVIAAAERYGRDPGRSA